MRINAQFIDHDLSLTKKINREINYPACLVECVIAAHKIKMSDSFLFFFCTKEKLKWTILVRGMTWCDDAKQGLEENRDYCSSPAKRKTILLLLTKVWRVSSVLWKGKCHRPLQRRGVAEISVPEESVANHGHLLSVTIRVFVIGTALQNNFSVEAGIHTSVVVDQKLHDTLYFVCHYFITTQTNRGKKAVKTIKIWTCNPSDMYG